MAMAMAMAMAMVPVSVAGLVMAEVQSPEGDRLRRKGYR
jgi:hypothetical protein